MQTEKLCSIDGCGKPHYGRGWCEPVTAQENVRRAYAAAAERRKRHPSA